MCILFADSAANWLFYPRRYCVLCHRTGLAHVARALSKHLRLMEELALHWMMDDFGGGNSCLMHLAELPVKHLN